MSSEGVREMYTHLTEEEDNNLVCAWNSVYARMLPSITYLDYRLTDGETYVNTAWCVLVTERVALIAIRWLHQVYICMKLWHMSAWTLSAYRNSWIH